MGWSGSRTFNGMSSKPKNVVNLPSRSAGRRVGWASDAASQADDPAQPTRQQLVRDVTRLTLRVEQHENALARLTQALLTLRRGSQALREENKELRRQLETERRLRLIDEGRRQTGVAV